MYRIPKSVSPGQPSPEFLPAGHLYLENHTHPSQPHSSPIHQIYSSSYFPSFTRQFCPPKLSQLEAPQSLYTFSLSTLPHLSSQYRANWLSLILFPFPSQHPTAILFLQKDAKVSFLIYHFSCHLLIRMIWSSLILYLSFLKGTPSLSR